MPKQQAQRGLPNYRGRSVRGPPPQFYRPKSPAILNSKSNEEDEPVSEVECICGQRIKVPKKDRSGSKPIKQEFSGSKSITVNLKDCKNVVVNIRGNKL
ncbi:hypothetical protein M3Y97_01134800 [Aphelenchoides bicaudatus]|nr:hypothetical protein M3Y97_01134800 [Aphelenchoides bicaudatus]